MRPDAIPAWVPLAAASAVTVCLALGIVRPAMHEADALDARSARLERVGGELPVLEASLAAACARRDVLPRHRGIVDFERADRARRGFLALATSTGLKRTRYDVTSTGSDTVLAGTIDGAAAMRLLEAADRLPTPDVRHVEIRSEGDGRVTIELMMSCGAEGRGDDGESGGVR